MNRKVITISRQCGSGEHTIGKMVAGQLKILFYDKKLMEIISERSGFSTKVIEQLWRLQRRFLYGKLGTKGG